MPMHWTETSASEFNSWFGTALTTERAMQVDALALQLFVNAWMIGIVDRRQVDLPPVATQLTGIWLARFRQYALTIEGVCAAIRPESLR